MFPKCLDLIQEMRLLAVEKSFSLRDSYSLMTLHNRLQKEGGQNVKGGQETRESLDKICAGKSACKVIRSRCEVLGA